MPFIHLGMKKGEYSNKSMIHVLLSKNSLVGSTESKTSQHNYVHTEKSQIYSRATVVNNFRRHHWLRPCVFFLYILRIQHLVWKWYPEELSNAMCLTYRQVSHHAEGNTRVGCWSGYCGRQRREVECKPGIRYCSFWIWPSILSYFLLCVFLNYRERELKPAS